MFQLEKLISKNYFLHMSAKEAFKSYVRAYDSHQLKTIFDVDTLDLMKVGKSFGFTTPPAIDLRVTGKKDDRPRKRTGGGGYGHFKNLNTPGSGFKRDDKTKVYRQPKPGQAGRSDKRQFTR